jgi:hypothetical protein
VASLVNH